jgi:hypothetical protein
MVLTEKPDSPERGAYTSTEAPTSGFPRRTGCSAAATWHNKRLSKRLCQVNGPCSTNNDRWATKYPGPSDTPVLREGPATADTDQAFGKITGFFQNEKAQIKIGECSNGTTHLAVASYERLRVHALENHPAPRKPSLDASNVSWCILAKIAGRTI